VSSLRSAPGAQHERFRSPRFVWIGRRSPVFTLERAADEFFAVADWLLSEEALRLPLCDVERQQEPRAREAQRLLLQAHVQARGDGDVGPALRVVRGACARLLTHRRFQVRQVTSVFGEIAVERTAYGTPHAASIHPLDQTLAVPERSFAYEVQRRLVKAAVQGPFDEAVERVEESTGVAVPKRSAEDVVRDAAEDFDEFYAKREVTPPEATGPIVVGAIDGKGVPMVKPETALRTVRRGKGEKANKKRMATVATVFTMQPRPRTPKDVVETLFRTQPKPVDAEAKTQGLDPSTSASGRAWSSRRTRGSHRPPPRWRVETRSGRRPTWPSPTARDLAKAASRRSSPARP